ncbi:hypothetical protein DVH24_020259 [Malus domestica]|uniref:Uncharacterized protein n=1 Tax=Malus domestica TaxID=3750 RepID=A0A498J7U5_MALDO|nr:hypothetical protein DVH24_020259 [Malus domestica]
MMPFGNSLASDSVETLKLNEITARAILGWVTHWEVLVMKFFRSSLASGSAGTPKLSESNSRMGDPLGSSLVSFQKQKP